MTADRRSCTPVAEDPAPLRAAVAVALAVAGQPVPRSDPCALRDALEIAAPGPGREDLLGVGDAVGIEGFPQAGLGVEVVGREDQRHVVPLLQADAVLAGQ